MITTRMGRWYRLGRSTHRTEGGPQVDEHPAGEAEADQVDAAGPGGADAEGGQQEAGEGGQVEDRLERVGHGVTPSGFETEQALLTRAECGPTYAKRRTLGCRLPIRGGTRRRASASEGVWGAVGAEDVAEGVA